MIQECRAKYYFPGLGRKIRAWVTSCSDCIANKRIDTRQIRPRMLSNTEFTMGPEECQEVDIMPNLPSSNGYQQIITILLLPHARYDCQNGSALHHRRNDKTMLSTNCHTDR